MVWNSFCYKAIKSTKLVADKRLRIVIASIKEILDKREIYSVADV